MSADPAPRLTAVHRALADPLRVRLYELLVGRSQSAKELAERVGLRPDRLYHHLAQLEDGKLIEVAEYRRLPGGKVERVYAPAAIEPVGDDAAPAEVAVFLTAVLEITQADVNAATEARQPANPGGSRSGGRRCGSTRSISTSSGPASRNCCWPARTIRIKTGCGPRSCGRPSIARTVARSRPARPGPPGSGGRGPEEGSRQWLRIRTGEWPSAAADS